MGQGIPALNSILRKVQSICIDTAPLIYHLQRKEPYFSLTKSVFSALDQRNQKAILSTVSITEVLTKPLREGDTSTIDHFETFVVPNLAIYAPTYDIAKRAAELRAKYPAVRTPDALIIATALTIGCDAVITNDKDLKKLEAEGVTIVVLSDFAQRP